MRYFILSFSLFFAFLGCNRPEETTSNSVPKSAVVLNPVGKSLGFMPLPIKASKDVSPQELMQNLKRQQKLVEDFSRQAKIILPNSSTRLSLVSQVSEANSNYIRFIKENSDNAQTVKLFRSYFAPILLNDYGLLKSNDYNKILFYTNELIESKTKDVNLIFSSLSRINGNISSDTFNKIKQESAEYIENEIRIQEKAKLSFTKAMSTNAKNSFQGNTRPEFQIELLKSSLENINKQIENNKSVLEKIKSWV
jgi:hypothetical protein